MRWPGRRQNRRDGHSQAKTSEPRTYLDGTTRQRSQYRVRVRAVCRRRFFPLARRIASEEEGARVAGYCTRVVCVATAALSGSPVSKWVFFCFFSLLHWRNVPSNEHYSGMPPSGTFIKFHESSVAPQVINKLRHTAIGTSRAQSNVSSHANRPRGGRSAENFFRNRRN